MCELEPSKSLSIGTNPGKIQLIMLYYYIEYKAKNPDDLETIETIGECSGLVDSVRESLGSILYELEPSKSLGIGTNPGKSQLIILY